jgi:hypothetical protein
MSRNSAVHHRARGSKKFPGKRLTTLIAVAAVAVGSLVATNVAFTAAQAVGASAISSTTNIQWPDSPGNGSCLNGGPGALTADPTNCNSYADKEDVWLSGLSDSTGLPDGDYYFEVRTPGGAAPLSTDPTADRTFSISGGAFSYGSLAHAFDPANGKLQVAPFADTTNHGGVYILAVCPVTPGMCKKDAFKVKNGTPPTTEQGAPTAEKTAVPTHVRKVHWGITKLVDGHASETFNQSGPATLNYTVAVTKTVDYDTYGLTGTITVTNTNADPLDVTVAETGLDPAVTGSDCGLDASGELTVPAEDPISLDPGMASVDYTCTFTDAPDPAGSYTNTATVTYDIGNGDEVLDVASDPFQVPAPTLSDDSAPETITIGDPNAPAAAGFPKTNISGDASWSYSQQIFNANCQTYGNTATIVETAQSASTSVVFCGPNNGGLTMGWWQNKNGQALLKANLTAACSTVNGYLPSVFTHGALTYLPDAYTANKSFNTATYQYIAANCTAGGSDKSYLPTFDLNVFTAANAAGTGTLMVEGQWLTTALDTAPYAVFTSAGKPTLSAGQKVQIPAALQSGLALAPCDTIGNLLTSAASRYPVYAPSKSLGVTPGLITLLNAINNNQAITCV